MKIPAVLLIGLALAGAACGANSTVPTTVSTLVSASTEVFAGKVSTSGNGFYSFTSIGSGLTAITFGSLTSADTGAPLATTMKIGLGIPAGTGCGLITSQNVAPALVAQINVPLDAGTFCVSITDLGGLAGDANFAVRITQGTLTLKANASPEPFVSNLAPNGSSTRTFVMPAAGSVTLKLDGVTPSTVVGFGLGIWRTENSTCNLNQSVTSGPGAQFTATVDQGIYCVRVFDVGNLTDFVAFSASIVHP